MVQLLWNGWRHRPLSKHICKFSSPDHTLECHVIKKGLLDELHLSWVHRIWGQECALGREDEFARVCFITHFLAASSETCCSGELFDCGKAFPVSLRAVVDFQRLENIMKIKIWKNHESGNPLGHVFPWNARKNFVLEIVAETREEMKEVMNELLIFFDKKIVQRLKCMDDEFWLQEML